MELTKVQDQLRKEFSGKERTIVFWYDESGEFAEDIDQLEINAEIFILNGKNYFEAKYKIEYENPTSNYLVYAPFKKPDDELNPLLDTLLYSIQFYADHYSLLAEEIGVPNELKEQLESVNAFFASKARRNDFINLNAEYKNEQDIYLSILAVLSKTKIAEYIEVFKSVVNQGIQDNKYLEEFNKYNVLDSFWTLTGKYFGYYDEQPSLEKLLISIFLTDIYNVSEANMGADKNKLILSKKLSESTVFLTNFKNNIQLTDTFNDLSEFISQKIDGRKLAKTIGFENIKSNDVFKAFDIVYIEQLLEYGENQVNLDMIEQYLDYRENTHFFEEYKYEYESIRNAFHLLDLVNKFNKNFSDVDPRKYADEYAVIDMYYDQYVYNYNKVNNQAFNEINELVENKYNNAYFNVINMAWDKKLLEYGTYDAIPGTKQKDFYSTVIYKELSKNKVCVIISDAFRYECGMQLKNYLDSLPKYEVRPLRYMVSTIPSYTELGMAALLPSGKLTFASNYKVLHDNRNTDGIDNRNNILNSRNRNAVAVKYDDIKNLTKHDLRGKLSGVDLLYVYHNQVDARGDNYQTENEVFDAVQEGIEEIELLMRKLRDNLNFTQFFITSDHGFINRRKKMEESDKINLLFKDDLYINRRYVYSRSKILQDGTIEYKMEYLDKSNSMYTYVPKGGNIFKVQGPGQNYVHGGASLQEIIIPLIEVKTTMRKVSVSNVNVDLIAGSYKINSIATQLKFVQVETVTDKILPQTYRACFVDKDGNAISNECMIYANSTSGDVQERMTICKFNFISKKYDSTNDYYLVIKDENGLEYKRFNYIVDII